MNLKNIIFIVKNSIKKLLFNFVFCGNKSRDFSVQKTLEYFRARNIEATWVIDPYVTKINDVLEKRDIKRVGTPKKVLLNMKDYLLIADVIPDLKLDIVSNNSLLDKLDLLISKIFHHSIGIIGTCFRRLSSSNYKDSILRFFVTLKDEVIGTCAFCIQNDIAGFYGDGVLPCYRNSGINTQIVLERIKIIRRFKCKYIVAHCMKLSVNLYKKLGFQILGNLYLYTSSA